MRSPKQGKATDGRKRPKTATRGKRLRCAICQKRSPKPVKTPAPWYCEEHAPVGKKKMRRRDVVDK